jgi:hypothetical protein
MTFRAKAADTGLGAKQPFLMQFARVVFVRRYV